MEYLKDLFAADTATIFIAAALLLMLVICFAMLINASSMDIPEIIGGRRKNAKKRRHQKTAQKTVLKDLVKSPRTKSEAYAVKTLEEITGLKFPTAFPSWLHGVNGGNYELDGYNEEAKIGIEFSGPMHTKWIQDKESYEEYLKRVKRDELKIKLCAANGVSLIIINCALPVAHMRAYLKSRLYDIGWLKEKPFDYILEQKIEPYRLEFENSNVGD